MFQTGYILNRRADTIWFLTLPFWAVAFALTCQQWLPVVAIAAVGFWVTIPHQFVTWLRAYGMQEDWNRWKTRFIFGPLIIFSVAFIGVSWAPLSLLLIATFWGYQHALMQQHGLARIYDFKARTGGPTTPKWDLTLNWILYSNLILTAPLFSQYIIRELFRFGFPVSAEGYQFFRICCWSITGAFLVAYSVHVIRCLMQGYALNPIKYLFLFASYFLWYFIAWHTNAFLVQAIAHALMHGIQYIVIVYFYIERKEAHNQSSDRFVSKLVRPGSVWLFLLVCFLYALIYHMLTAQPLEEITFGFINFPQFYQASIPEHGMNAMSKSTGYDLFAAMLIEATALIHYYFDSFIWRVRDVKVQEGLA